jgi:hypothetical protein
MCAEFRSLKKVNINESFLMRFSSNEREKGSSKRFNSREIGNGQMLRAEEKLGEFKIKIIGVHPVVCRQI